MNNSFLSESRVLACAWDSGGFANRRLAMSAATMRRKFSMYPRGFAVRCQRPRIRRRNVNAPALTSLRQL